MLIATINPYFLQSENQYENHIRQINQDIKLSLPLKSFNRIISQKIVWNLSEFHKWNSLVTRTVFSYRTFVHMDSRYYLFEAEGKCGIRFTSQKRTSRNRSALWSKDYILLKLKPVVRSILTLCKMKHVTR